MRMGSENQTQIPFVDFCKDPLALEQGTEGWTLLCQEVRDACERFGCFQVASDKIPSHLREDMFGAIKLLFDLPVETKKKNFSLKPYYGYVGGSDVVPLYESLGVEDAPRLDQARAFTELMWPDGNPSFCQTLNSTSSKVLELDLIIRKMIFDSFGAGKCYDSHVGDTSSIFRVMKYNPPVGNESAIGLVAHTDKNFITILCLDEVQGLEVQSKDGDWIHVPSSRGSLIVIVGESFKAWSNGRLHPVKHRVMLSEEKERFSYGLFSIPKEGGTIEVPKELVDNEHPLLFRPFNFMDFLTFIYSDMNVLAKENALEIYAGV
ncbi:putative 2-oxoglutarate-dependent dioxygenase AOP1 [Tasmannia lanceolata]|uniref:putative 2-oxoglutarate-dependent dioxygenase AOP1 n=1 Tax=Tasmannia lanceolata TaxID=3420 RepID=UPI00406367D1